MSQMPANCPACNSEMVVTQLSCTNCETAIVGHYPLSAFSRLVEADLAFLEAFIRNRGNVKEMEREMSESYWTIRNRLDKVIGRMGFDLPPDEEAAAASRKDILARLSKGDIDVAEATRLLKELGE
ncbi:MAG: DUF2089 domain-containing protein [Anaerolineae bacterium]|nr:MAG: DUF2089 domain-containing protein [Anaerolineae bacterium]